MRQFSGHSLDASELGEARLSEVISHLFENRYSKLLEIIKAPIFNEKQHALYFFHQALHLTAADDVQVVLNRIDYSIRTHPLWRFVCQHLADEIRQQFEKQRAETCEVSLQPLQTDFANQAALLDERKQQRQQLARQKKITILRKQRLKADRSTTAVTIAEKTTDSPTEEEGEAVLNTAPPLTTEETQQWASDHTSTTKKQRYAEVIPTVPIETQTTSRQKKKRRPQKSRSSRRIDIMQTMLREHYNDEIFSKLAKFYLPLYYLTITLLKSKYDSVTLASLMQKINKLWQDGVVISEPQLFALFKKISSRQTIEQQDLQECRQHGSKIDLSSAAMPQALYQNLENAFNNARQYPQISFILMVMLAAHIDTFYTKSNQAKPYLPSLFNAIHGCFTYKTSSYEEEYTDVINYFRSGCRKKALQQAATQKILEDIKRLLEEKLETHEAHRPLKNRLHLRAKQDPQRILLKKISLTLQTTHPETEYLLTLLRRDLELVDHMVLAKLFTHIPPNAHELLGFATEHLHELSDSALETFTLEEITEILHAFTKLQFNQGLYNLLTTTLLDQASTLVVTIENVLTVKTAGKLLGALSLLGVDTEIYNALTETLLQQIKTMVNRRTPVGELAVLISSTIGLSCKSEIIAPFAVQFISLLERINLDRLASDICTDMVSTAILLSYHTPAYSSAISSIAPYLDDFLPKALADNNKTLLLQLLLLCEASLYSNEYGFDRIQQWAKRNYEQIKTFLNQFEGTPSPRAFEVSEIANTLKNMQIGYQVEVSKEQLLLHRRFKNSIVIRYQTKHDFLHRGSTEKKLHCLLSLQKTILEGQEFRVIDISYSEWKLARDKQQFLATKLFYPSASISNSDLAQTEPSFLVTTSPTEISCILAELHARMLGSFPMLLYLKRKINTRVVDFDLVTPKSLEKIYQKFILELDPDNSDPTKRFRRVEKRGLCEDGFKSLYVETKSGYKIDICHLPHRRLHPNLSPAEFQLIIDNAFDEYTSRTYSPVASIGLKVNADGIIETVDPRGGCPMLARQAIGPVFISSDPLRVFRVLVKMCQTGFFAELPVIAEQLPFDLAIKYQKTFALRLRDLFCRGYGVLAFNKLRELGLLHELLPTTWRGRNFYTDKDYGTITRVLTECDQDVAAPQQFLTEAGRHFLFTAALLVPLKRAANTGFLLASKINPWLGVTHNDNILTLVLRCLTCVCTGENLNDEINLDHLGPQVAEIFAEIIAPQCRPSLTAPPKRLSLLSQPRPQAALPAQTATTNHPEPGASPHHSTGQ